MVLNRLVSKVRRIPGMEYWSLADSVKRGFGSVNDAVERFKEELFSLARHRGCDAIPAGHVHMAALENRGEASTATPGDRVESCTAILEDFAGNPELVDRVSWSRRQQGSGERLPMPGIEPVPAFA